MSWIDGMKVILFVLLVLVSTGLFLYTRRKEQKRKPTIAKPPIGVSTHLHRDVFDYPAYVGRELVYPLGNEPVLEMLMQKQYKDAVLTAEYWEDPKRPGTYWRAWYPLHVPCTNTWIEWPALVSYRSTDNENKTAFFLDTNRFKWYHDSVTNEPVWVPKKGGDCFTVGQVLLTNLDDQNETFVIEESELSSLIPH